MIEVLRELTEAVSSWTAVFLSKTFRTILNIKREGIVLDAVESS